MVTVNEVFVGKPSSFVRAGPTENLRIHSEVLCRGGSLGNVDHRGIGIECRSFGSSNELSSSIIIGLQTNWRVRPEIVHWFQDYTESDFRETFAWRPEITLDERNELGKYLGELLPGLVAFTRPMPGVSQGNSKLEFFRTPNDPSYSGIDSIFSFTDREVFVSSKYGPGARASVFSNIVPRGLRSYGAIENCEFKTLLDATLESAVTPEELEAKQGSKKALYHYGVNHVLGMKDPDPVSIFSDVRRHILTGSCLGDRSVDMLNRIDAVAEDKIRSKLPGSATQFFSRTAAARMNGDDKSITAMKSILMEKDYVQLNLDKSAWHKGSIRYDVSRSTEAGLKITGDKGIIGDIDSRHGTINYCLVK